MRVSERLLEILACPEDKGPLYYFANDDFLYNPRLKRKYPVRDDIAVMLIEESVAADEVEHSRVTALITDRGIKATFGD